MDSKQQEQLDQQRRTWDKYSAGWRKWDEVLMTSMRPVSEGLIESLHLNGHEHILDVASGTGEPGLSLSSFLPQGRVTGSDLSEKMVEIANDNARILDIANYQSVVCDASKMPFEDDYFDHLLSRFGIMFFPDMQSGLREMIRVVKPGGRLAIAVWADPALNPFITILAKTVREKLDLPKPSDKAPGIFRCAQSGFLKQMLKDQGLHNVTESNISGEATFDTPIHYWDVFSDVAGPVMQALNSAPQQTIDEVKESVLKQAEKYIRDGKVYTGWQAILATGIKP